MLTPGEESRWLRDGGRDPLDPYPAEEDAQTGLDEF